MKKFACFLLAAILIFSCADDDANESPNTYEYFQKHLNPDMKYNTITAVFGEPADDIGSGIHIYVYNLNDGSHIVIGYTDFIMYARHLDKDNQLVDTLI
jgi:hypothetical protein